MRSVRELGGWSLALPSAAVATSVVLLLGSTLLAAPPAAAQSLLVNGGFAGDLAGWTQLGPSPGSGSSGWDDDSGSPAPGGLRLQYSDDGSGGGAIGRFQCIEVSTGTLPLPWDFGGRLGIISQTGSVDFLLSAQFFPLPGCGGLQSSTFAVATGSVAGMLDGTAMAFQQLEGTRLTDPMPGGNPTASMRLLVAIATNSGADTGEAIFDHLYFGGDGTVPVSLTGFAIE